MALINLHHDSLFAARLPVYTSPTLSLSNAIQPSSPISTSRFDYEFHSEIANLQQRRDILSQKLAHAKGDPENSALRQEILKEFSSIEQSKKLLAYLADAVEKSRQNVAANLR